MYDIISDTEKHDRSKTIGGSDAASILGISPWKSRLELWHEKVTGNIAEVDNPDVYLGKLLEPIIVLEYERQTSKNVTLTKDLYVSKKHSFMSAHLDGIIDEDKGVLEVKTKGAYVTWKKEIPDYYYAQIQHYLAVTGFTYADFVVLDLGKKCITITHVAKNKKYIDDLIIKEKEFWDQVLSKTEPRVDNTPACEHFLHQIYQTSDPEKAIDISDNDDANTWALLLKAAREKIKEYKVQESQCKNELMNIMKSAEIAIGKNYKITWQTKNKQTFKLDAFKKDHEDLYKAYITEETERRFIVRFKYDYSMDLDEKDKNATVTDINRSLKNSKTTKSKSKKHQKQDDRIEWQSSDFKSIQL